MPIECRVCSHCGAVSADVYMLAAHLTAVHGWGARAAWVALGLLDA